MKRFSAGLLIAILGCAAQAQSIDIGQSRLGFTYKQMGVPMEGHFKQFSGQVQFDAKNPAATAATLEIPIAGIDVGSRDAQPEVAKKLWFDSAVFPRAQFVASSSRALSGNRFETVGKLSLKGGSQNVTLTYTAQQIGNKWQLDGSAPLKRLAFKIGDGTWSDTDTVADEVLVKFRLILNP